jgi:Cu2+-exporting ATPase/Cu+-exporting ATPase
MATCVHCDEIVLKAFYNDNDLSHEKPFCCQGCLTVFNVLHEKGLDSYYEIKNNSALLKRRSPVEFKNSEFKYLDDGDFLSQYSFVRNDSLKVMEFYLEGIHCLACLWLIEKLPEFLKGVISSKLDLERSVVTVALGEEGKFSEVARELNHLGYRPHPLRNNQEAEALKRQTERLNLIRIGVAGAAAGNIMLYAVSLYGGASGEFSYLFNNLTVAFGLPVLTFSAFPFYQTAWNAIKNKTLSIDIPISMALIFGAVMGIYNLLVGVPENYFDSLSTLVFLLLLSRYFLQKIQERGLSAQDLHYFYQTDVVFKKEGDSFKEIHPRFIKVNDILKIKVQDFIPVDGEVIEGESLINNSLLTGESLPIKIKKGDVVFSGTQNLNQEILIQAKKIQEDTRLGKILKNVEHGWSNKSKMIDLMSLTSKYFTLGVILLALILFISLLQYESFKVALEHTMTLLIVTCPCALALAVPLTFTRTLSKASGKGIIIKNDEVIEKLNKVKNIFLDKTGTLTYGKLKVEKFQVLKLSVISLESVIQSLETYSKHPVAKALIDYVASQNPKNYEVKDFKEILGVGVSGLIQENFYEIKRDGIFENGVLVATFGLRDIIRPEARSFIESLRSQGYTLKMLSGDKKEVVESIANEVGLLPHEALSELTPEEKQKLVQSTPQSMMVGDGANDAIALSYADVGVAVYGSMDLSLRAAEVYLTIADLKMIQKLLDASKETLKIVKRNLVLSILYNGVSVIFVFMGLINPLVAAIIMPVSSLTVLFSTLIGTKKMRLTWKS